MIFVKFTMLTHLVRPVDEVLLDGEIVLRHVRLFGISVLHRKMRSGSRWSVTQIDRSLDHSFFPLKW